MENTNIFDIKDIVQNLFSGIMALLIYIFNTTMKKLKEDNDSLETRLTRIESEMKSGFERIEKINTEAHKELWEKMHEVDKEQSETKTIVSRCKSCSGA